MNAERTRIEVAVAFAVYQTYTYVVPEEMQPLVRPGKRVLVPFGSRQITGYVIGFPAGDPEVEDLKPVSDILDDTPIFPEEMIPFFRWVADYYIHPIGDVICDALPGGINPAEYATYERPEFIDGELAAGDDRLGPLEKRIVAVLEQGPARAAAISKKLDADVTHSTLQKLERQGWIHKKKQLHHARTRHKTRRYAVLSRNPSHPSTWENLSEPKIRILEHLSENGETAVDRLKQIVPTAANHVRDLCGKGLLAVTEKPVYRDPFGEAVEPDTPPKLTGEQQRVINEVAGAMNEGFAAFLLAGVTGSGKTEVYMQLAAAAIEKGRTVLVLVPEIALISEIERRFRARFGECVAVLHSGLSAGERFDQWMRIARGQSPIAIGARSAIFAPFARPGLLIVDEEHDTSYKQEGRLHYNARDLAVVRAKQADGVALLGSATPSIQSVNNVASGKFRELNLTRRIHKQSLPEVHIEDLRNHKDVRGTGRFITATLHRAVKETLARGEQVLLFLNRRGFASYPVCASCGAPQKCRHCDITLTLHKKANIYKCHMCGYFRAAVSACDTCGAKSIKQLGLGTEKLEAAVQEMFPEARTARMDKDTTSRKGALIKILKDLRNGEIDILVGTQMVAKGHDFPNITLVGIICADLSLSFPDFRAGEMTFQVLAQVSGRAGRGTSPGRVILQTYNPEHFSIVSAQQQDFMRFYKEESRFRKALKYPPYARMVQIKLAGKQKESVTGHAQELGRLCQQLTRGENERCRQVQVLGPIEAPLARIAGRHRWQILLKAPTAAALQQFVRRLMAENPAAFSGREVHTAVDVDPFFMM
uniref:DNA 3'-5' helicase n=1 Tax=uncultured organism TaxID=155900 RepID=M1QBA5_9ZZZZ|nr:primosome assembly protein PriA [uncultured organism]